MKNLQELIEDYNKSPNVETQQKISKFYIKANNKKDIVEELKNFIRNNNLKGGIEWYGFFEGDKELWSDIYLIKEEKQAQKSLKYALGNKDHEGVLDFAIDMCDISCRNTREIKGLENRIIKVWSEVFHEFPDFEIKLKKSQEESKERIRKHIEGLNLPIKENLPTVQTLKMTVPVLCIESGTDDRIEPHNIDDILNSKEYIEFMQERIEFVNNFQLQSYMNIPQCTQVKLEVEDGLNIFTLKFDGRVNTDTVRKELLGQLSDGLGESLEQQPLMVGDSQYYFGFNTKAASQLSEIKMEEKLTTKPKLKIK